MIGLADPVNAINDGVVMGIKFFGDAPEVSAVFEVSFDGIDELAIFAFVMLTQGLQN